MEEPLKFHKDEKGETRDQEGYKWHEQSFGTENVKTKGADLNALEGLYGGAQSILRMFDIIYPPGFTPKNGDVYQSHRKFIEKSMWESGLDYDERFKVKYFPIQGGVKIVVVCKKSMLAHSDRFDYSMLPEGQVVKDRRGTKVKTQKIGDIKQGIIDRLKK